MPENLETFLDAAVVTAPSPAGDGSFIRLRVAVGRVVDFARSGRNNDIFALVYNLFGILPPVNNIGYHERESMFEDHWGGLRHAHAIFQGLKRPFHDADHDSEVYIYVVSPRFVYRYEPGLVCVARRLDAPTASVFVAYVKFHGDNFSDGEVINWEWVKSDSVFSNKPKDFKGRYDKQVWENG